MKKIKQSFIVFKRNHIYLSIDNKFRLYKVIIDDSHGAFMTFIDNLVNESNSTEWKYINVYRDDKEYLEKIAWIKEGILYTL